MKNIFIISCSFLLLIFSCNTKKKKQAEESAETLEETIGPEEAVEETGGLEEEVESVAV